MLTKIQEKRLLNVAKALRDAYAKKKKFDMGTFVYGSISEVDHSYDYESNKYSFVNREENFCGTPACALGHYAARTDLQRLLKIVRYTHPDKKVKVAALAFFGEDPVPYEACPQYNSVKFEKHFGLEYHDMDKLFGGDGCGGATTALQAAKFIEKFVKQKQRQARSMTTV